MKKYVITRDLLDVLMVYLSREDGNIAKQLSCILMNLEEMGHER